MIDLTRFGYICMIAEFTYVKKCLYCWTLNYFALSLKPRFK